MQKGHRRADLHYLLSFLIISHCLFGCGGGDRLEIAPVKGKVTLNGQPIEGAQVTFTTEKAASSYGLTDAKGEFQLTTFDTNDGAVVGENVITIRQQAKQTQGAGPTAGLDAEAMKQGNVKVDLKRPSNSEMKEMSKPQGIIPAKYSDAKQSDLKRTVVKGTINEFSFDLKP